MDIEYYFMSPVLCFNKNITKLFQEMFPDSGIAEKFSCGERKSAYVAVFGIAEHFEKMLNTSITGAYSISFDESLNKKDQTKQMDIHERYMSGKEVVTRYCTSEFLGHAAAKDMLEKFCKGILYTLKPADMVQLSMDGPNVNWNMYDMLTEKLQREYRTKLLNIGSCGLHTVHSSFKTGADATGWGIGDVLSSLYYLFKNTPARREDSTKITGSKRFPLKFAGHRWLENVPGTDRAIAMWDDIVKYVTETEKTKKIPACESYEVVRAAIKDHLILAKFPFFKSVALLLEPFLKDFQTESPMAIFWLLL